MIKHLDGITDEELREEVKKYDFVVVDFFATWCNPCQMLGKVLEEIENKYDIIKIDVDKSGEISMQNDVEVVPTLLFFKNGEQVYRESGFFEKDQLLDLIEQYK